MSDEKVDHPAHYGGADDPYEAVKVIEAWGLPWHLGDAVKYIARHGKKPGSSAIEDLQKSIWYLQRYVDLLKKRSTVEAPETQEYLDVMKYHDQQNAAAFGFDVREERQ